MANDEVNTHELNPSAQVPLVEQAPVVPEIDDSDNDDDSQGIPEPPVAQGIQVHRAYPSSMTLQGFGIQAFLWIQLLWNVLSYVSEKTVVVSKSIVRGIQAKTYVFFEGSSYPYRIQDYSLAGPGVAPIEWFYDADKKVFLDSRVYNSSVNFPTRHFEWLSGEIKHNNLVLYDISDYLEEIRWAGAHKPSPSRVLAAWSLHSGIVLNAREGLTLHTINEDGSESRLEFTA